VRSKRLDWKLLLASLGIAAGVVLAVLGVMSSVTGREEQRLPDAIEAIDPIRGATQVPQQTAVFVDLQPGYFGELTIDRVPIETVSLDEVPLAEPGQQVTIPPVTVYEPGNATLSFTPIEGAAIEEFTTGLHTASVTYWPIVEPDKARTYTWTFYVV
jgi:hypothetical protein